MTSKRAEETGAAAESAEFPVPYYNPLIPDERFRIGEDAGFVRFANGRFLARDAAEAEAVEAALRVHGADKPARWRGDDRKTEWRCRHCGFATYNEAAQTDHERSNRH